MKKLLFFLSLFCFLLIASNASAHQPNLIFSQQGDISINNPETSRAFYDELKGRSRDYFINSDKDFRFYLNLLVPNPENRNGRYSADVFDSLGNKIYSINGDSFTWEPYFENFGRDWYLKGPELDQELSAGNYKIEVYSLGHSLTGEAKDNTGKYVLAVGETESFDAISILNIYWQLPLLKLTFFKTSVLQFFITPFGIAGIGAIGGFLIFLALINYLVGYIKEVIKHNQAKTLLLTSGGMLQMQDEIIKLLQKPAYDVTVAFITTAYKPELQENPDYISRSLQIMRDMGFNVEEIDIEGKNQDQLMKLFELKDIIYVAGGNTFYLLNAMRRSGFEKVIRKLLKSGKVYIGSSAGSIVAGRTIQTSDWKKPENRFGVRNLKGLNLVPFDIFVHYTPEYDEIIKQQIKNPKKRAKNLRIITDDQGILVQGKEIDLIGDGEAIII